MEYRKPKSSFDELRTVVGTHVGRALLWHANKETLNRSPEDFQGPKDDFIEEMNSAAESFENHHDDELLITADTFAHFARLAKAGDWAEATTIMCLYRSYYDVMLAHQGHSPGYRAPMLEEGMSKLFPKQGEVFNIS